MKGSYFSKTLVLVAWIAGSAVLCAQPWIPGYASVPFFRATTNQAVALTNRNQSALCLSNLRSLGVAARIYSDDNGGGPLPTNWQQMTNYFDLPQTLYCPADIVHPTQTNWANVNFSAVTYNIVSPGANPLEIGKVYIKCPIHQNVVYVDGAGLEYKPYERFPASTLPDAFVLNTPALQNALDKGTILSCISNLKSIAAAAKLWAFNNGGFMPGSLNQISNELGTVNYLYCPANATNPAPGHSTNFAVVNYSNLDYTIVSPGIDPESTNIFVTCRLHGSYATAEGYAVAGTNRFPPRIITGHPLSRTAAPGASITLEVLTGNDPSLQPFTFQWRKKQPFDAVGNAFTNTVLITGATNSYLTLNNVQATNEGYYDVVVRDATGGYQESYMAYLRVEPLANITNSSWQALNCINNLKQIGIAARLFASSDPSQDYPTNFASIVPFAGWPMTVFCPSDSHVPPSYWTGLNFTNSSYIWNSNVHITDTTNVLATCKIHGFVLRADGSLDLTSVAGPQLNAQTGTNKTILSWTNLACTLQSSTNAFGPYTNVSGASGSYTNSTTVGQQYFRLKAN